MKKKKLKKCKKKITNRINKKNQIKSNSRKMGNSKKN